MGLILATDVHYRGDHAVAAGVGFSDWGAATACLRHTVRVAPVAAYEPGAFYKRELPCLLALLDQIDRPSVVIIDGYVWLGADQTPGLGAHLFDALGGQVPVIGVAKSEFAGTPAPCRLTRAGSKLPLFITSAGLPLDRARAHIAGMHGAYRLPTLLREADQLGRQAGSEGGGPA